MDELKDMLRVVLENNRECDVCIYGDGCPKGVSGGPNGPLYPPCSDGDYERLVDEKLVEAVYSDIMKEVDGDG